MSTRRCPWRHRSRTRPCSRSSPSASEDRRSQRPDIAVDEQSPHHVAILPCWERLLGGEESIGLPWVVLAGFLRIITKRRAFAAPLTADAACAIVDDWPALDVVSVPLEKLDHWTVLRGFVRASGTAGNLVTDAHIAAIAATRGTTLVSCDRGSSRFDGLHLENPLAR